MMLQSEQGRTHKTDEGARTERTFFPSDFSCLRRFSAENHPEKTTFVLISGGGKGKMRKDGFFPQKDFCLP